jgi:hypothetical protein
MTIASVITDWLGRYPQKLCVVKTPAFLDHGCTARVVKSQVATITEFEQVIQASGFVYLLSPVLAAAACDAPVSDERYYEFRHHAMPAKPVAQLVFSGQWRPTMTDAFEPRQAGYGIVIDGEKLRDLRVMWGDDEAALQLGCQLIALPTTVP